MWLFLKRVICEAWYHDLCLEIIKIDFFAIIRSFLKVFLMNIFVPQDPLNTSYMLKIESEKLFFDMIHPPRLLKDLVTVRLWAITVFLQEFLSI